MPAKIRIVAFALTFVAGALTTWFLKYALEHTKYSTAYRTLMDGKTAEELHTLKRLHAVMISGQADTAMRIIRPLLVNDIILLSVVLEVTEPTLKNQQSVKGDVWRTNRKNLDTIIAYVKAHQDSLNSPYDENSVRSSDSPLDPLFPPGFNFGKYWKSVMESQK